MSPYYTEFYAFDSTRLRRILRVSRSRLARMKAYGILVARRNASKAVR